MIRPQPAVPRRTPPHPAAAGALPVCALEGPIAKGTFASPGHSDALQHPSTLQTAHCAARLLASTALLRGEGAGRWVAYACMGQAHGHPPTGAWRGAQLLLQRLLCLVAVHISTVWFKKAQQLVCCRLGFHDEAAAGLGRRMLPRHQPVVHPQLGCPAAVEAPMLPSAITIRLCQHVVTCHSHAHCHSEVPQLPLNVLVSSAQHGLRFLRSCSHTRACQIEAHSHEAAQLVS